MTRINVTKAYLPDKKEFLKYIDAIWDTAYLTNHGPLLQQLEKGLTGYLGTKNVMVCSNGTVVLQMALKALSITKEVITTPFSYVATVNAIVWENCTPVFVDIDPQTLCIDADKIEAAITSDTQAIMCTHVYGLPCNVEKIAAIAAKHHLKVIYDGAHAFAVKYKSKSLLSYGDVSTCSFHATKLFHTAEGGCIIANDEELAQKIYLFRQFGHINDDYYSAGINGKNSELHAAMGLCVLKDMPQLLNKRKLVCNLYDSLLGDTIERPYYKGNDFEYNYSYYPVLFNNEAQLQKVKAALEVADIYPRRYFYPSLNLLSFVKKYTTSCPVSEDISVRVMCLPLYADLPEADIKRISEIVLKNL